MKPSAHHAGSGRLPQVSPTLTRLFAVYSRVYLGRHFHSLRIFKYGLPPHDRGLPLVIYLNHAAWWDPLVCLSLAREFFPERRSYAPIDAAMLTRYAFFRKMGFFGIEPRTPRGACTFLRTADEILRCPSNALWITPQGRFTDVRERPVALENGLGVLAARDSRAVFVPLAIEYSFWTEPRPEILVAFGAPVFPIQSRSAATWTSAFADALEETQDALSRRTQLRDPVDWITLNRGKTGVGTLYDGWRWLNAKLRRTSFASEHPGGSTR